MECFVFKGIQIKKNASEMRLRICSDEYSQNIISFIQIPWFYKLFRVKTKFKIMKFKIESFWILCLIMELFKTEIYEKLKWFEYAANLSSITLIS